MLPTDRKCARYTFLYCAVLVLRAVIRAIQCCLTVPPYCLSAVLLIVTGILWTNKWRRWWWWIDDKSGKKHLYQLRKKNHPTDSIPVHTTTVSWYLQYTLEHRTIT